MAEGFDMFYQANIKDGHLRERPVVTPEQAKEADEAAKKADKAAKKAEVGEVEVGEAAKMAEVGGDSSKSNDASGAQDDSGEPNQ